MEAAIERRLLLRAVALSLEKVLFDARLSTPPFTPFSWIRTKMKKKSSGRTVKASSFQFENFDEVKEAYEGGRIEVGQVVALGFELVFEKLHYLHEKVDSIDSDMISTNLNVSEMQSSLGYIRAMVGESTVQSKRPKPSSKKLRVKEVSR